LAILFHGNSAQFKKWDTSQVKTIPSSEILFENAFNSLNLKVFFENFEKGWSDFFTSLDFNEVSYFFSCKKGLSENTSSAFGFNIKNENAAVLISDETRDFIIKLLRNGHVPRNKSNELTASSHICLEYFVMRFIWSFLEGIGSLSETSFYKGQVTFVDFQEYSGETIGIEMRIGSYSILFEVILPPSIIECISRNSDVKLPFKTFKKGNYNSRIIRFSAPLHTMIIDPSSLIDFLRPEAIILMENFSFDSHMPVLLDQELESYATLYKNDGYFLFKFINIDDLNEFEQIDYKSFVSGTQVQVQIVDENIRVELLASSPTYYKSSSEVSSLVSLKIGGEVVARGELGYIDDTVAIRIIPKV
jgi:hypothetical protein